MTFLLAGLAVLAVFYVLGRAYANADPRSLVRSVRYSLGGGLLLFGLLLLLAERAALGSLLVAGGLQALATGRLGPFELGSRRRSAWLEIETQSLSGKMSGRVLRGRFAGRQLNELDRAADAGAMTDQQAYE